MRVVLKAYQRQVLSAIDQSKREDWMHQPFEEDSLHCFQAARTDILQLLDRGYFQQEERELFVKVFLSIWERCKGSETVFQELDHILEKLRPFIPRAHPREELSFAYMIDVFVLSFTYFTLMRVIEYMREGRVEEDHQEPLNVFPLLGEVKDLLFDLRCFIFPSTWAFLHVKGVRLGIDIALHLTYPSKRPS